MTAGFKKVMVRILLIGNFRVAVRLSVTPILRLELELSKCARWATARWHLWLKLKKVCERDFIFSLLHFSEDVLWAMWLFTDLGDDSLNSVKFNSRKKEFYMFTLKKITSLWISLEMIHKLVIFINQRVLEYLYLSFLHVCSYRGYRY